MSVKLLAETPVTADENSTFQRTLATVEGFWSMSLIAVQVGAVGGRTTVTGTRKEARAFAPLLSFTIITASIV